MNYKTISIQELPLDPNHACVYNICSNEVSSYTHGFFKYPCKFIPHIPRWAINKYCANSNCEIIDPFCGSGTTLLEAVLMGHNAYGVEIDSLGQILTEVKTKKVSKNFKEKIDKVLKNLSDLKSIKKTKIPKINNLTLWFNDDVIEELGKIRYLIDERYKKDQEVYRFLLICFASIIRKVSNADNQSPKPYVSRRFPKEKLPNVLELFVRTTKKYLHESLYTRDYIKGETKIIGSDARNIVHDKKFDLAITSPPYINAFDYVRTLRLENLWLGLDNEESLKDIKKDHVGTESISNYNPSLILPDKLMAKIDRISKNDKKKGVIVQKFFEDMSRNIKTISDNLKNNGHYIIVVGDSKIKNEVIETYKYLSEIATNYNFVLEESFPYIIKNRYLRIPRQGRGGFIKHDWVISLRKGK